MSWICRWICQSLAVALGESDMDTDVRECLRCKELERQIEKLTNDARLRDQEQQRRIAELTEDKQAAERHQCNQDYLR